MHTESIEVQLAPVAAPLGQAVGPWAVLVGQRYVPLMQAQAPPRLGRRQPEVSAEHEAPNVASGPQMI
jgi:hypothetical protein